MNKIFRIASLHFKQFKSYVTKVVPLTGGTRRVSNTKEVTLRGSFIKGNYNDLPNLIFFSETLDPVTNWIPFFTNPDNKFLDFRNIYLINPRNIGTSDYHDSFGIEEMADDVVRFMYENKISTATIGGHGLGGKLALAVGCYHSERVTGVFCIDSAPLDHRYHEAFREFKNVVNEAHKVDLEKSRTEIEVSLKQKVLCPKWRKILNQNLLTSNDRRKVWNFNLEALNSNLQFNKADSLGYWASRVGMFPGRAVFIFPDQSRWVHLNTNTLPMLKVCARLKGLNQDIFAIQGDENPLNHWMYDSENYSFPLSRKLLQFLTRYDGVHNLLYDRSEVGKYFIPDRPNSRSKPDWEYSDYSPAHLHHNWRFSNVYEKKKEEIVETEKPKN